VTLGFTGPIFWRIVRTAPSKQDALTIALAIEMFDKVLDIAETKLSSTPFLAWEAMMVADVQFGRVPYRYFDIEARRCWSCSPAGCSTSRRPSLTSALS
jgi:glutathione S-transferase